MITSSVTSSRATITEFRSIELSRSKKPPKCSTPASYSDGAQPGEDDRQQRCRLELMVRCGIEITAVYRRAHSAREISPLTSTPEGCQSGRMGQSRKLLRSSGPPWVRIPRLPPVRPRASMEIHEKPAEQVSRESRSMGARRRFRCVRHKEPMRVALRVANVAEDTTRQARPRCCGRVVLGPQQSTQRPGRSVLRSNSESLGRTVARRPVARYGESSGWLRRPDQHCTGDQRNFVLEPSHKACLPESEPGRRPRC